MTRYFIHLLLVAVLGVTAIGAGKISPHDLLEIARIGNPRISPDGSRVVFQLSRADTAVSLSESMAASEEQAETVVTLVEKARRELDAGRTDEAHWWASVALNALGMTDQAIDAATRAPDADTPE